MGELVKGNMNEINLFIILKTTKKSPS